MNDRIWNSLWRYAGPTDYKWEGMASNKVDFSYYSSACTSLTTGTRAVTEFEYTSTAAGCPTSCTGLDVAFFNAAVGHTDYHKVYVTFRTSHIAGNDLPGIALYEHTINHETGHGLGLKDPNYTGHCVDSVIHSTYYGCSSDRQFPTGGDIWNGTLVADDNVPEN